MRYFTNHNRIHTYRSCSKPYLDFSFGKSSTNCFVAVKHFDKLIFLPTRTHKSHTTIQSNRSLTAKTKDFLVTLIEIILVIIKFNVKMNVWLTFNRKNLENFLYITLVNI